MTVGATGDGEGSDEVGARDSKDAAKLTEWVEGGKMCPVIMKRGFFRCSRSAWLVFTVRCSLEMNNANCT